MTQFGELSPRGTAWSLRISETDRKLHIIRHYAGEHWKSEADTLKEGWVAKEGWFAFVENGERVWAYDGDKDFFLLVEVGSNKGVAIRGPCDLACPVPEEVLSKLSPAARQLVESHGQR